MGAFGTVLLVASRSLRYRLSGVLLTIASVALSVFVLLGVEHVRQEARSGFASTVSGVDLIVGARTGEINLLLLSIFRIGTATANVSWESVEQLNQQKNVDWTVPISLGDSHRNFRVIGTTQAFFSRYKYGAKQPLVFEQGQPFEAVAEVVLGARVARELGYQLGDSLVLSHGMADTSFTHHDQLPFAVSGVLVGTGTPIDNALFVGLDAIDAMHSDEGSENHQAHEEHDAHEDHDAHKGRDEHEVHEDHDAHEGHEDHDTHGEHEAHEDHDTHEEHEAHEDHDTHEEHGAHDHPPIGTVTAVLVGLSSPITTLQVKRWVDEYEGEALLAIVPGVALTQLWELIGNVESVLLGISVLILVSSLLGLNAMLLASMRERRREIEVLRSIGAPSSFILALLMIESLLIVSVGVVLALGALLASITAANTLFAETFGLMISSQILSPSNVTALGLIYLTAVIVTLLPALQAYRVSRSVGAATAAE
ncbi:MAG: FtsX-like permease family protein [Pseudomonadota bacterium]|nr:FtsX-like permease family protein [Pseudomonadota bacterium]MEC8619496.1 FtsX-like permease family protein [Pseudomonadota bacterium]